MARGNYLGPKASWLRLILILVKFICGELLKFWTASPYICPLRVKCYLFEPHMHFWNKTKCFCSLHKFAPLARLFYVDIHTHTHTHTHLRVGNWLPTCWSNLLVKQVLEERDPDVIMIAPERDGSWFPLPNIPQTLAIWLNCMWSCWRSHQPAWTWYLYVLQGCRLSINKNMMK